jgi:hypothetical protein
MKPLACAILLLALLSAGCAQKKAAVTPESRQPSSKSRPAKKEPVPVRREPPAPPIVLSPEVSQEEEDRLKQEAKSRIDEAERIVQQIDRARLAKDQRGTFLTIQSFLSKAREALSVDDFLRAFNLADKAQILAHELLSTLH